VVKRDFSAKGGCTYGAEFRIADCPISLYGIETSFRENGTGELRNDKHF
jgi:hypothetical protein